VGLPIGQILPPRLGDYENDNWQKQNLNHRRRNRSRRRRRSRGLEFFTFLKFFFGKGEGLYL